MSLSDCPKCWNAICTCGHMYEDRKAEWIEGQIRMLQGVLAGKVDDPDAATISHIADLLRGDSRTVVLFDFDDAPAMIREMSPHGGDEEEVLIVSKEAFDASRNDLGGIPWFDWFSDRLTRLDREDWMDATIGGLAVKVMIMSH